jgi:iron complex transport system ATP-binding protein
MLLRDLEFGYRRGVPVVRRMSAQLLPGRVCALLGPNAAGKSTLLRLMLGQLEPARGAVMLEGRVVWQMKPGERASRLAYVPQRPAGDVAFTVAEVVALGRFALPVDEAAVERALEVCELAGLRDQQFNQLSAGQQQRVAIGRAVAQVWSESSLVGRFMLLDEPVNAMDLRHVHQTMALLAALAGRGLGVLIVQHDLNLAAGYADDVWLMHSGSLVAAKPWEQVLTPEVLEPVYEVKLRMEAGGTGIGHGAERPLFFVEGPRTLV